MKVKWAPVSISSGLKTRDEVTDIEITGEGYTLTFTDGSSEDITGQIKEVHQE